MRNLTRFGRISIIGLIGLLLAGCAAEPKHLGYKDMLDHLTNLQRLPVIEPGVYCGQFSSYDRRSRYDAETDTYIHWDANGDAGNYIRVDPKTKEGVMAEMDGPGCIFRIWSANPQGVIRFYLDGDTEPTYEWDFMKLTTGQIDPFIEPLVWKRDPNKRNSASNIYLPIPFARSCKVTSVIIEPDGSTKTPGHYYIINYRTFPENWTVDSFKLPLSEDQRQAVQQTAEKWANRGDPVILLRNELTPFDCTIEPGASQEVPLKGPALIRTFQAKLESNEEWATRKVVMKIYWDGAETPAVNCPIGDFFGEPKDVPYKSYPMGITEDLNYCLFPMPFHQSARIVFENDGTQPAKVRGSIEYRLQDIPRNWGLFHAKWRGEFASRSFDYPLIETTGTGKLVGICLFPDNIHGGWWGEGDEKVYVDGEKFPSWFGTGSEDYFGDAWGIRKFHNPSHGFPQPTLERLQGCYRWHLGDNIPYYKSFYMTIENYTGTPDELKRNDYSSVAYWYQLPGGSDFFTDAPVDQRVPRGYVATGAVEAEWYLDEKQLDPGMSIIYDDDLPQPLSSNRGIRLTGKVGDTFTLNVPAAVEDFHVLGMGLARGVKASQFQLLRSDKVFEDRTYLKAGNNPIMLQFTGKPVEGDRCEVIVDYFHVKVYRNLINEWMVIGPFPNPARQGFEEVYPPERELDMDATYEGRDGAEVRWQRVTRADGMMQVGDLFDPHENLVVYGACVVHSPEDAQREMLVGSDDGIKVWVNGKLVHKNFIRRGIVPDQDRFMVDLRKGANTVLVKIDQGPGDVGWAVRFMDPTDELTYGVPE